jgi:hypothetical protein
MIRIYALLIGVALTLNGCATAGPIAIKCGIQDVQIAAADYAEIKADIQSKNWTDLAKVGESIGWATLDCVLGDEATKNQAAKPSIDEFRQLHAVEFRSAKSACRSPGDATPKTGPTAREDGAGSTPAGWPTTGSKTKGLDSPNVARVAPGPYSYPGPNPGASAEQCDRTCHEHLTGLATVDGCECHRKINGVWRWVAAR